MVMKKIFLAPLTAVIMLTAAGCGERTEITEERLLEIDFTDEDGAIYYKNPSLWTTERIYENLTVSGRKIEAPLTVEKMGDDFCLETSGAIYDNESGIVSASLLYKGVVFANTALQECQGIDDTSNKGMGFVVINNPAEMSQADTINVPQDAILQIKIMDVGIGSSRNDVISQLGTPMGEYKNADGLGSIWYSFGEEYQKLGYFTIRFSLDNDCVNSIIINFVSAEEK